MCKLILYIGTLQNPRSKADPEEEFSLLLPPRSHAVHPEVHQLVSKLNQDLGFLCLEALACELARWSCRPDGAPWEGAL